MRYILGIAILVLMGCQPNKPAEPERAIHVEVVLDDSNIPKVSDARVIVLPSGERILVMTGPEGLATCCLLPPRPLEGK